MCNSQNLHKALRRCNHLRLLSRHRWSRSHHLHSRQRHLSSLRHSFDRQKLSKRLWWREATTPKSVRRSKSRSRRRSRRSVVGVNLKQRGRTRLVQPPALERRRRRRRTGVGVGSNFDDWERRNLNRLKHKKSSQATSTVSTARAPSVHRAYNGGALPECPSRHDSNEVRQAKPLLALLLSSGNSYSVQHRTVDGERALQEATVATMVPP